MTQLGFGDERDELLADIRRRRRQGRGPTQRQRAELLIRNNRHPVTGLPLRSESGTCGECANTVRLARGGCKLIKCNVRDTRSATSDVRLWYPACLEFRSKED